MYFHYGVTFMQYILCFCATTSRILVTLSFDLLILAMLHIHIQGLASQTDYQFLLFYDYRLNYWIGHISVIGNSHYACAVARHRTQKWSTVLKSIYRLKSSLRMRIIAWPVHRVPKKYQTLQFVDPDLTTHGATMTIKGSLCWSIPTLNGFQREKLTNQNWSPKWRFSNI